MKDILRPLVTAGVVRNDADAKALALLKAWDGVATADSTAASIAVLTWKPFANELGAEEETGRYATPLLAFQAAVDFLVAHYGKVEVPLGDMQRLRRGTVDLPIGGGPDVLAAVHTKKTPDGKLVGFQGDSYILIVDFTKAGPVSRSLHQYGDSNRPSSPHYADQAPMFIRGELKPALRTREELSAHMERAYHPGD
jgi:acyl-homoserine lactone acylase PvdQ